jgi:arylsulfatase A-like enzyme
LGAKDLDEWFEHLRQRAREEGPGLTMAYWPEPDYSLHRHGPDSPAVERIARDIDAGLRSFSAALSKDDLVIVTGDHGHIEVDEYVDLGKIEPISEAMLMPPYLEARAAFFFVRQERRQSFERAVGECLGRDFMTLTREEVLNREAFGPREGAHPLFESFVADYLVIATGKKALKYYEPLHDHGGDYPSHHAGLTEGEVRVPLAFFSGMDN